MSAFLLPAGTSLLAWYYRQQILFAGDVLDRSASGRRDPTADLIAGARRRSPARARTGPGALDHLLGTAVAGSGIARDRDRPVPGGLLARALALAAADRADDWSGRVFPAHCRGVRAAAHAARAEPDRR